ncbi:MAG TPA: septal ring lytic transglycosylase RlpA family protein [Drouetiella sp.]
MSFFPGITRFTYSAAMLLALTTISAQHCLSKSTHNSTIHPAVRHNHHSGRRYHIGVRNHNQGVSHQHHVHGGASQSKGNILGSSGKATIYSDKFNGRKTATGERFRQDQLTAASPHLPLGSKVKVTNKSTGKSVTVKVNDRQASGGNRVVDLSKAAASKIGVKGTGNVETKVVGK